MTPKEKARELYNLMYSNNSHPFNVQVRQESAKQCALIAVNEILDNFGLTTNGKIFFTEYRAIEYWQQVKQEIENL